MLAHEKNGEQAIGRSRGGLTTKIHVLVDALGNPVEVMLTPGQAHDLTCAEPLLDAVDPETLIGDKAFDAEAHPNCPRENVSDRWDACDCGAPGGHVPSAIGPRSANARTSLDPASR